MLQMGVLLVFCSERYMNMDQSLLVRSPEDLSHLVVFNTSWHLYFLHVMLKLKPGKAFIKTEAWLQLFIHS